MKDKTTEELLRITVDKLVEEYMKVKGLYDNAGAEAELKQSALQGMANVLQLQSAAIQNYANWKHIEREDKRFEASLK